MVRFPWKAAVYAVAGLIVLILLFSMWFTVEPEEVGVITRFGKFTRVVSSGLHIKAPFPIERVTKVPVERQLKEEFGFRTEEAGVRTRYSEEQLEGESLMLTGDLNVAVVEWTTQFRVREPYDYLFKVRNLRQTFRDMNETIMREVIGDRSVNEVLTIGRQDVASEVERRLQELCNSYEMGLAIEQVVLQNVDPPDLVRPSFNEVNQAQQERERMINEARAEYNSIIPRARGRALQTIAQAEGFATDRVNRAEGDAELFNQLYAEYRLAPDVTRRRIYLETMAEIYPRVKQKIVVEEGVGSLVPLLNLQDGGAGQ